MMLLVMLLSAVEAGVLTAVILAFVALAVLAFVLARRPSIPDGKRFTSRYGMTRVTVVVSPAQMPLSDLVWWQRVAAASARAAHACTWAWIDVVGSRVELDEFVVRFVTDSEMDARMPRDKSRSVAAYQTWTGTRMFSGRGLPLLVIRIRHSAEVIAAGEPVIHEAIHALADVSGDKAARDITAQLTHTDARLWAVHGAAENVQATARARFLETST